jgi:hypothetical protein
MSVLVVGVGKARCGDAGVGHFVIDVLRAARVGNLELRTVQGLIPELAAALPGHEAVVFVGADVRADEVRLRPLAIEGRGELEGRSPERVLLLAQRLGFTGEAWICGVPVRTTDPGGRLSRDAVLAAGRAAAVLLGIRWLYAPRPAHASPAQTS